jgi:hypothetical protein
MHERRQATAMPQILSDEEIRKAAKARAGFKIHAFVYVLVNLFLVAIWFVTTRLAGIGGWETYWPIWPHLGWGLGLAIHGFVTYGAGPDWTRREEERLRRKYGGGSP